MLTPTIDTLVESLTDQQIAVTADALARAFAQALGQ